MFRLFYDTDIFKNITRMVEFYDKIGFLGLFENGAIQSTNQIYMNPEARTMLLENLINNMNKNEYYQNLGQEESIQIVIADFVQFAPQTDEKLTFDQIMVLPLDAVYVEPETDDTKIN